MYAVSLIPNVTKYPQYLVGAASWRNLSSRLCLLSEMVGGQIAAAVL